MNEELTITEILKQSDAGKLSTKNLWYDWFCKETSLENRGKRLIKKLKSISRSTKFDSDKTYVLFKNNCPLYGKLYDDFRICDLETGDVIYAVIPSSGHTAHNGVEHVFGRENNFEKPIIEGSWKEIKNWFLK